MPAEVTVKVYFEAAHRLHNPERPEDWNRGVFGKCNNPLGHGHNYVLEVTVVGPIEPDTGYLIDMKLLKDILRRTVVDHVDHRHLNHEVDWLAGVNPTAENLARVFFARVAPELPDGVELEAVTVHETERNSATWRR
jgi:6-pyruvoyltetrahydropterin/6-carboxytetrahydropterin synthase